MFDLLIRGERVVTPHGVGPREIAIKDGVIAALGAPGTLGSQAGRVIDAGAGIVMPGGIDPHVHCAWYIPPPPPRSAPTQRAAPAREPRGALGRPPTTPPHRAVPTAPPG